MTRTTNKKKRKGGLTRFAELIAETSFPAVALEVLETHYSILNTFCASSNSTDSDQFSTTTDNIYESSTRYDLSFHHYCVALSTLIQHGSPAQQLQYLCHTYATNELGIDRSELLQLLKDHSELVSNVVMKDHKLLRATDPRHFDKLYTWLKKHFILFDESRSGFLPEKQALELLQSHPTALSQLKFQLTPFIKKVKENNVRYANQVAASKESD